MYVKIKGTKIMLVKFFHAHEIRQLLSALGHIHWITFIKRLYFWFKVGCRGICDGPWENFEINAEEFTENAEVKFWIHYLKIVWFL